MIKKLSNKGSSFLEVLCALVIIFFIVLCVGNFQLFIKQTEKRMDTRLEISKHINNEITDIYTIPDWTTLTNKNIKTKLGNINVEYFLIENTEYETNQLQVKFTIDNISKEYVLERSVYINE